MSSSYSIRNRGTWGGWGGSRWGLQCLDGVKLTLYCKISNSSFMNLFTYEPIYLYFLFAVFISWFKPKCDCCSITSNCMKTSLTMSGHFGIQGLADHLHRTPSPATPIPHRIPPQPSAPAPETPWRRIEVEVHGSGLTRSTSNASSIESYYLHIIQVKIIWKLRWNIPCDHLPFGRRNPVQNRLILRGPRVRTIIICFNIIYLISVSETSYPSCKS